jgi:hypothetical protein
MKNVSIQASKLVEIEAFSVSLTPGVNIYGTYKNRETLKFKKIKKFKK